MTWQDNLLGRPWTEAEREILREAYARGGIAAAMIALPDRTETSLYRKVYDLKLGHRRRRWTVEDDARLRAQWGHDSIAEIARGLGRTHGTVHWRAQSLGLELGCPQGWEYVSDAAQRTGYPLKSLQRILRWARVRMANAYSCKPRGKRGHHIVEPFDVDDAIERWHRTETLTSAARRMAVFQGTLLRWATEAAVKLTRTSRGSKSHIRAESSEFDRAAREHQAMLDRTEALGQAARRVGVTRQTLREWLARAGHTRQSKFERFPRELVDQVVALERRRDNCRAPARPTRLDSTRNARRAA